MLFDISCQNNNPKSLRADYIYPISYKIAKKGKPPIKDLLKLKIDITRFYFGQDACVLAETTSFELMISKRNLEPFELFFHGRRQFPHSRAFKTLDL